MLRTLAPVATLLIGIAILLIGQGLQGILIPVRANLESFSTLAVGFVGATYFLGFTFGSWKGARLIARTGHVRVFAAMTALASACPLLLGLWINLWSWGLLRFLSGFCFAVLYVVIESWLNERSTNENRGKVFSVYILINMTMLAAGQQILILADPSYLNLFAIASVLVSLAAVPVALSTSETPREVEDTRLDLRYAFRTSPAGMLGSLSSGLTNGAFWALAPLFIAHYSNEVSMVAWFMTAVVLGGAAGQFPIGHLSDRIDRRRVIAAISVAGAVICMGIVLLVGRASDLVILAMGFIWGTMTYPVYSISVAHANDRADPETYVIISSALLMMYGIGAVSGPFLASAVMTFMGAPGLYVYTGVVHALFAFYVLFVSMRKAAASRKSKAGFDEALASALTTSNVYSAGVGTENNSASAEKNNL